MTDDEMMVKIAEACPTVFHRWAQVPGGDLSYEYKDGNGWHQCLNDDPLSDLNAMHEAEKTQGWHDMNNAQGELYYIALSAIRKHDQRAFCATARQRAEAFLKVHESGAAT